MPTVNELNLPERVRIDAPLINGEQYLRDLNLNMAGPFSTGYGGALYATCDREYFLSVYARSRGARRADLAYAVGAIDDSEYSEALGY